MVTGFLLGRSFPADLNGNFFTPLVLERAGQRGWPVFFLGGRPGVADRAAGRLRERFGNLIIAGTRDGYFGAGQEDAVVAQVRSSGAGLLLVALGNPLQECWLDRHLAATGARLGIGVGAFFDFQTKTVPRAPQWMNKAGLEWVHRLYKESTRMWRRYLLGNPAFVAAVVREQIRRRTD
jgi:exopolysaccharide biosynthesis WecB/TagA/CpsF family protein